MRGHQIIQTSCRRGISGGGSGFQVYSCDEDLAQKGFLNSAEYQKLFIFDTPVEVGISSFGYSYVEGIGSIFSLNTRLAYDFGGAGTRSGNLLNHSIVSDGPVNVYPTELFGSPVLRTEMRESEVNSNELPEYLPQVEISPAGIIDINSVAEWLDDNGGVEVLERMLVAYLNARAEGRTLILFDTPDNVIRWIAALEYCLPLKAAREISFINYSENAASAKATIAGTTYEKFESNTPSYMHASLLEFDPKNADSQPTPEGPFVDFIDISYSLNPSALTQFADFMNANIAIDGELTLDIFNSAFAAYSLTKNDTQEWTPAVIRDGLSYSLSNGENQLNNQLARIIEEHHDEFIQLDSDSYLEILEYMIKRWPTLDEDGKKFVEGMAVGNIMKLLQQIETDESVFQDYFDAIAKSCAAADLNIFEILMGDEFRTQLFTAAQHLSLPKLRLLALSLTEFALASNQPVEKLTVKGPLGSLYACLLQCSFAHGSAAGTGLAQCIIAAASTKLSYLQNLMLTIDWATRGFFHRSGVSGSPEEQAVIDALWDSCITHIATVYKNDLGSAVKWLVWAAEYDQSRFRYIVDLYERFAPKCNNTKEARDLFSCFCPASALASNGFMANAYPYIASTFSLTLSQYNDDESLTTARALLESSLNAQYKFDFIPSLMETVSENFGLKRTSSADIKLVDRAADYECRTGWIALSGRAALIRAAMLLEDAPRMNSPESVLKKVEALSSSLNLDGLDDKAFKEYIKRIAPALMRFVRNESDLDRIAYVFNLNGERLAILLDECFDVAMKAFTKRGNQSPLITLTLYAAIVGDRSIDTVCVKAIASAKSDDDLFFIDDLTRRLLRESGHSKAMKHWERIFNQAYDRRGQGLFGRFRR